MFLSDLFEGYSLAKRFALRPEGIEPQFLLEVDDQILQIEAAERRYREKVAALERAAQKSRRR